MNASFDVCFGAVLAGPPTGTAGDPATHQYTVQARSQSSGRVVYTENQVVQRPDMTIPQFPLAVGDPVQITVIGSKVFYFSPISKPDWLDCPTGG